MINVSMVALTSHVSLVFEETSFMNIDVTDGILLIAVA